MLKNLRRNSGAVATVRDAVGTVRTDLPAESRNGDSPGGNSEPAAPAVPAARSPRAPWLRMLPESGALLLCVVLYSRTGAWDTTVEGPGPEFYPRLLIGLLAVAMLVRIGQHVLAIRRDRAGASGRGDVAAEESVEEGVEFDESAISNARLWQAIALALGYVIGTLYLGWVIATFVFVVVFLYLTGKRRLLLTVPLAATIAVGFAYVFVKVVYIALPTGVGVFDLFTLRLLQAIGAF